MDSRCARMPAGQAPAQAAPTCCTAGVSPLISPSTQASKATATDRSLAFLLLSLFFPSPAPSAPSCRSWPFPAPAAGAAAAAAEPPTAAPAPAAAASACCACCRCASCFAAMLAACSRARSTAASSWAHSSALRSVRPACCGGGAAHRARLRGWPRARAKGSMRREAGGMGWQACTCFSFTEGPTVPATTCGRQGEWRAGTRLFAHTIQPALPKLQQAVQELLHLSQRPAPQIGAALPGLLALQGIGRRARRHGRKR